jgi:hypothetical protein
MEGPFVKSFIAAALLSITLAASAADAPSVPVTAESTARALVILIDGKPQAVIFISKTGQEKIIGVDACQAMPACIALGEALAKRGDVDSLNFRSAPGVPGQAI